MKRYFDLKVLTTLLAITVLFAYCKKGDTGATGATGPAGAAGAAGATGSKGDTGTANVIYSPWLNLTFADTSTDNNGVLDTLSFFYVDINAPKLDTSILSTGDMKVYVNIGTPANSEILPLPYFDANGNSIQPIFFSHGIELQSTFDASTFTDSTGAYNQQYRYIIIPGSVLSGKQAHPDWKDYKAVKAFYHIKD